MRRSQRAVWFVAKSTVLSLVLGWLFWSSTSTLIGVSMLAAPVVSVMLAAEGFTWKRKLVYAVATTALYILGSAVADATGLMELANRQLTGNVALPSVWVVIYMTYLTTFPLLMLVLFAGRTPSLLWSRSTDSRPPSR